MTGQITPGLMWLRTRRHHSDGVRPSPSAEEWHERADHIKPLATPTMTYVHGLREIGELRGHVKRGRGGIGDAGSGSVPWYVPEGAEWDLELPNSTARYRPDGECAWAQGTWDYEYIDGYHRRADALHQEESEDWDLPCLRPPQPHLDVDLFDDVSLEERYLRMCEYQGWEYSPLISRPPSE